MDIVIRKMRQNDVEDALRVLADWNMSPRFGDSSAERSELDVGRTFVAEYEDRIVGVASYLLLAEDVAETASLAVVRDYKGMGIGYRLQAARLEEMRQCGIRKVRTETDRPETIAWYMRKFGYRIIGTSPKKHEFSLPDVDEWTVLELDLTPPP